MTASYVTGKRGAAYEPRQILVSLAHVRRVMRALKKCGANPRKVEQSKDLGLALVSLDGGARLRDVTRALLDPKTFPNKKAAKEYRAKMPKPRGRDDLDPLLVALRISFWTSKSVGGTGFTSVTL